MTNEPPPDRPTPPHDPATPSSMPRETPMSGATPPPPATPATPPPATPATPPPAAPQPLEPPLAPKPAQAAMEDPFGSMPFPLQDGERVLAQRRKHWIFLWPKMGFLALVGIIPVLLVRWLLDQIGALDDVESVFLIIAALWLLFWLVRIALTWYRFQHDFWVITTQRLVDVRRLHPFDLTVNTADLVNVQDMSVGRKGILATVLDFGDIHCQTASADGQDFRLSGIPNPRETQILVDRERDRERLRVRGV